MLTEREVLATLEMLRSENLDVRTVTLGVSLFDCASEDPGRFVERVRARSPPRRHLVEVCDEVGLGYGIPIVNKRLSVSPIAVAAGGFSAEQMVMSPRASTTSPASCAATSSAASPRWSRRASPTATAR